MRSVQHLTILQDSRHVFCSRLSQKVAEGWKIISSGAVATSDAGTWWAILEKVEE